MRNLFSSKYMYLTAAMLTGAAMFTSCSNEDDMGNVNPTYDGESVKTQFAINIPYASNANTRMSADNTQSQGTPTFLGMYNIKLIPMTETGADNKDFTSILSLTAFSAFDNNADDQNSGFRKVYSDVNVPVGTKNFLFYGAGGADAPATADEKFAEGIITANITGNNTSNISFTLEGAKGTDTDDECGDLITVLNNVENVANWSTSQNAILKELYTSFIKLKAGSANSICKTLERLYNEVDVLARVTGTSESAETTIAKAIQAAITKDNTFTKSGDSAPYTLSTTLTYPRNMNMPDGSATVTYKEEAEVGKKFTPGTTGVTTNPSIDMANICYPASIYYFANTPLKATNATDITWPSSLTDWTNTNAFNGWDSEVFASTRSIALQNAIQYGVAKLALNIKCKTATLPDASGTASISVPNEGFTVTGILVGGQPASAKWDLTPSGEATTTFTKTIYDKDVIENMAAKYNVASANNYTLVLDNKATTAQTVNIAIELKNTSTSDFKGVDGIIPAGGTFYLLAQLNPANGGTVQDVTAPYVFMQKYTTTANLSITSLAKAYNVIPDLRASQLELGLAVDLDWENGLSFDVEIGGN